MSEAFIEIRGARQNNLAGIDVRIPRNRLVAVTGVSGSGKSSLAFDTLFREGQRRFLETLSAYARQFLGRMEKPDVDSIEGLSPAIAVDQHSIQRGPRSTVGTLTEIYDYLRVLYARAGTAHCPEHGTPIATQTPEAIVLQIRAALAGKAVQVLAPLVRDRKGEHRALFADLARQGFVRVRLNGEVLRIEDVPELDRYKRHRIEVVVDRLKVVPEQEDRLREAVGAALAAGDGDVLVLGPGGEALGYSTQRACHQCGAEAPPLEPRLFSFNSPHGACPTCAGLGALRTPSAELVVTDPGRSIRDGALGVTRASGGALLFPRVDFEFLDAVAESRGFDLDTPWKELPAAAKRAILHGTGEARFEDRASWNGARYRGSMRLRRRYRGVLPSLERAWSKGFRRKFVERFLEECACPDCAGTRLGAFARAVTVGGREISAFLQAPVEELGGLLDGLALSTREQRIAEDLVREIRRRVDFLLQVGLGYLALERAADGLSSGEAQRIRLAAQLGAGLVGVLYVLDEPSIGLHARDQERLLDALRALRDAGNTVLVVEHDEATLRAADLLIDVGPGAGRAGGRIAACGTPAEVARADTPTGRLLRGELTMPAPERRRAGDGRLVLRGARGFNLKDVDVELPLGAFTVVSGVSGSGKSTLVDATLRRAVARHLGLETPAPAPYTSLEGLERIEDLVCIDAAPIGRTPRSNPATYTGAFTPIRDLFATLPEARMRGWGKGRFSFNVEGGRCEACQGAGAQLVELQFLAPVTVPCPECGGHRFQPETLDVRYAEKSIADVLAMTADEALAFFRDLPKIARPLAGLTEVGLGYLRLGQPSTTLSGGEAQRVKLAKRLQQRASKHTLYLLDEPTTGLHQADVQRLVGALQALVDQGHTVLVIEHNLDLIRAADFAIDLGPEGGARGGRVLAAGTPEELQACPESHTGAALLAQRAAPLARARTKRPAPAPPARTRLEVRGARTHNLKAIDVDLPLGALTVVTGPSGSGKSSLALDTIHAAGRQRFVESLSTYARQFLASRDRPPVDRIEGLQPSVAVEARTSAGHPRSTLATTTEIHDYLRVLWARAGTRRCPAHGEPLERADPGGVARRILRELGGEKGWIVAPVFGPASPAKPDLATALAAALPAWKKQGFARVLVGGRELRIDDEGALRAAAQDAAQADLVIDRLSFDPSARTRIAEAVEQAATLSGGRVSALAQGGARLDASTRGICTRCGFRLAEELEPRHFSFNTHAGACPDCHGLGDRWQCEPDLLVDSPELPLVSAEGGPTAVSGKLGRYLTKGKGYYEHLLRTVADAHGIDLARPFRALPEAQRELLLFGRGARAEYRVSIAKQGGNYAIEEEFTADWPGLCGHVNAWHQKAEDAEWRGILEGFMRRRACASCAGERLASGPRAVTLGKLRLPELLELPVRAAREWLARLRLPAAARAGVEPVLAELGARLALLDKVGLDYLTLARPMSTLSGGEARRVRLSASMGSRLVGVCYVLDEPTVGLHPADIERLASALEELRDGGNTVLVVEHDEELMRRADHIVDMGPGAGRHGGTIVVQGTPAEVAAHPESLTGRALRGELAPEPAPEPVEGTREAVEVTGAALNNLRGVSFRACFGEITGVCGPSGSGKSTLVLDTFVPALAGEPPAGRWKSVRGAGATRRVLVVDASPLGRTPASVPATAVGLMEPLRELFARTPEARQRGFSPSSFSFNSPRGRCPACEGKGYELVEMQFLADLWLACEECEGRRYRPEVLAVHYRGLSVADVLALTVEEALEVFAHLPALAVVLATLRDVGLGYLSLGQSSTTLSSGEAQRVKLAAELLRASDGVRSIVVLDEPSTGLHASDVTHLARVLRRLAQRGDAVVLIEHHVGLLRACDRLVELGPGGGAEGGRIVAAGTPRELAADPASPTGPWLARALAGHADPGGATRSKRRRAATRPKVAS